MAKRKRQCKELATIWRCPDDLWNEFERVLDELDPPAATGRTRINQRHALDGIIFRARTGCQWRALPREFGDHRSIHRTQQRWIEKGVFELVWSLLVAQCDELDGVKFDWQAADSAASKARFGGIKSVKTPRIAEKTAQNAA